MRGPFPDVPPVSPGPGRESLGYPGLGKLIDKKAPKKIVIINLALF